MFRFLSKLEKKKFDQPSIDLYFEKAIEYVYDLFEGTIDVANVTLNASNDEVIKTLPLLHAGMDGADINEQEM